MSEGYVYILTNEAMPGLVKIGKTTRTVKQRISELQSTGVPFPFTEFASFACPDCNWVEEQAHLLLADCRVNAGREFFLCEPYQAEAVVQNIHRESVENWLEIFLPDHTPVRSDEVMDVGHVMSIVRREGFYPPDASLIVAELRSSEIQPALDRIAHRRKCKQQDGW